MSRRKTVLLLIVLICTIVLIECVQSDEKWIQSKEKRALAGITLVHKKFDLDLSEIVCILLPDEEITIGRIHKAHRIVHEASSAEIHSLFIQAKSCKGWISSKNIR